jgi:hypothetical protein
MCPPDPGIQCSIVHILKLPYSIFYIGLTCSMLMAFRSVYGRRCLPMFILHYSILVMIMSLLCWCWLLKLGTVEWMSPIPCASYFGLQDGVLILSLVSHFYVLPVWVLYICCVLDFYFLIVMYINCATLVFCLQVTTPKENEKPPKKATTTTSTSS